MAREERERFERLERRLDALLTAQTEVSKTLVHMLNREGDRIELEREVLGFLDFLTGRTGRSTSRTRDREPARHLHAIREE